MQRYPFESALVLNVFETARQGDPQIIFISGWNDWQYANQIEPAVEYQFKYVDMTARLLGRQAETQIYKEMD